MANLQISSLSQAVTGLGPAASGSSKPAATDDAARAAGVNATAAPATGKYDGKGSSSQNAKLKDSTNAQKEPPPPPANATQFVYVFDEQQRRNVVKLLNIETQQVTADPLPGDPSSADDSGTQSGQQAGAAGSRVNTTA